jgi:methionyl-tRNA formyltransferase
MASIVATSVQSWRIVRIAFLGTPAFALPSLEAIARGPDELVVAVTQPDRPRGRGQHSEPSPVRVWAEGRGIPVQAMEKVREGRLADALRASAPDLGVVVAYGRVIPDDALAVPRLGMINLHPSLLPRYRGAAPIQWAVANGDTETGVSVQKVVPEMDAGDVLVQRPAPIAPADDAATMHERLAALGAEALSEALALLRDGRALFRPQDPAQVTLAPILKKEDGRADFTLRAVDIHNRVRGFKPWPGVFARLQGATVKLHRTRVEGGSPGAPPGTVVRAGAEGIAIACREGLLLVEELQPEGKRAMPARDFLAGHRIVPGAHFD